MLQLLRSLVTIGFRCLSLALRQVPLPIGFAGLAMFIKELRGILMHLGRPVVNGGRMLLRRGLPDLMLLVLAIPLTHSPSLSSE